MKNFSIKLVSVIYVAVFMSSTLLASSDTDIIKEIIQHKIAKDMTAVGASIAIIENGEVEFLNFGLLNQDKKLAISSDTLFEIGSISKTLTSLALAGMVKEGKVKLTDPVQKFLPKDVNMPTRNGKAITLISLANHTSSLPRLPTNMPFGDPLDPYADYTIDMLYRFLNDYELTRDVGEKVEYSNLAVGLLGHVLGLIDNKTYQQVITNRVLKPLLMNDTFVDVPNTHIGKLSDGHDSSLKKTKHWQLPTLAGAGAIKSNIKDMALYLKANLDQQPLNDAINLTQQQTTGFDGTGPKVGLAWFTADYPEGSYLWHNGGTGGFRSFIGFDKSKQRGILILENTTNGLDAIGNAYLGGSLKQLKSNVFDIVMVTEKKLKQLNGRFELMPGFVMTVSNQGQQLFVQVTGQANIAMKAKSEIEFINHAAQAKITFELDDKGQVISLTLDQGGRSQKALKLSPDTEATQINQLLLTQLQLDNLMGEYKLAENFSIEITHKNGQLLIQATGQQQIQFVTKTKSEFFNQLVQAKIVFEFSSDGRAKSLTLFQAGQELKGVRVQRK
jgi:D-alanyl-D-alanine-carboxypeptidase/D-alanyl-D-alanine-endopeptidase